MNYGTGELDFAAPPEILPRVAVNCSCNGTLLPAAARLRVRGVLSQLDVVWQDP